jgi:hypothetical protein
LRTASRFISRRSIVTPEEGERYNDLAQQHLNLAAHQKFEEAQETFDAIDGIGRFVPWFMHTPEEKPIPIYPTIPTDMAHVIKIGNVIEQAI